MKENSAAQDSAAAPLSADDFLAGCNGAAVQDRIGRLYTAEEQALLRERSGATVLRPVRPGEAISMDFLTHRLTIDLDDHGNITALRCG